jgi:hypothetical protein
MLVNSRCRGDDDCNFQPAQQCRHFVFPGLRRFFLTCNVASSDLATSCDVASQRRKLACCSNYLYLFDDILFAELARRLKYLLADT